LVWRRLEVFLVGTVSNGGTAASAEPSTCHDLAHPLLYFLGNLVILESTAETFDVVDGQQRITTMSLIVKIIVHKLHMLETKSAIAKSDAESIDV
jgi:hypothetical protein